MTVEISESDRLADDLVRARVRVEMRDGVQLATDVYSDAPLTRISPRPVVLERTPYGIRRMRPSDGTHADGVPVSPESGARAYVERGYIVVRQDCRGRGESDGVFSKYVGEADDGYDTNGWLLSQPWCDGRIITQGVSYSAHVQAAAASVGARGFAALIMDSGGFSNAFEAGGRFGGAFELKQVLWAYNHALTSPAVRDDPVTHRELSGQDLGAWFAAMPWRKGFSPLTAVPDYEEYLFDQWSHELLDDYWTQPGLYAAGYYDRFPDVPNLHISSWYDPYVFTAVGNHRSLGETKSSPSYLILGPWTHGARSVSFSGDVDFGAAAVWDSGLGDDYLGYKAAWIAAALGDGAESAAFPRVSYFVMGGGTGRRNPAGLMDHGGWWRFAAEWPPHGARPFELYLSPGQRLTATPSPQAEIAYDFDPADPVPSLGGGITSGEPLMRGGAFDQTPTAQTYGARSLLPLAARDDVVAFQTEPLGEGVTLVGEIDVELDFSSSAPDTDITAKLVDVYPPNADYPSGFAMNITDGVLRCRYRDGFKKAALMEPGEVYSVTIRLPDTANYFAPGHRIRLDISSSNFPRVDVNPNTGAPVVADRTSQVARNVIHLGASRLTGHVMS